MPEKTDKEKQEKSKAGKKEITISIPTPTIKLDLDMGPEFKMKLVLLGIFAVVFLFSLYLFARAGFSLSDLFDLQRLAYNLPKLYSFSSVIFVVLYGIAIGLAAYYGFNLPPVQSALLLLIAIILAFLVGIFFPAYQAAFYGFGIAAGVAAIASSFSKQWDWHTAWAVSSKAMTALLILAFIFAFLKVSANKEQYSAVMFSNVASAVPQIAGGAVASKALNLCADTIDAAQIKRESVEAFLSKDSIKASLATESSFSALPPSTQDTIAASAQSVAVNQSVLMAASLKTDLAKALRAYQLPVSAGASVDAKAIAAGIPAYKQLDDNLPLVTALTVVSIVALLGVAIKVVATLASIGIAKALSA